MGSVGYAPGCQRAGCCVGLYTSAREPCWLDESRPANPSLETGHLPVGYLRLLEGPCGAGRARGARSIGLDVAIARITSIFGPWKNQATLVDRLFDAVARRRGLPDSPASCPRCSPTAPVVWGAYRPPLADIEAEREARRIEEGSRTRWDDRALGRRRGTRPLRRPLNPPSPRRTPPTRRAGS
jgi:hypothetical protein